MRKFQSKCNSTDEKIVIPVSGYQPGVYIVKLKDSSGVLNKRIIIQQ